MVAHVVGCDEPRLRSFLDDELPDRERVALAGHLESCAESSDGPTHTTIQGSGVAASKTCDVAGFNSVQIGSTFHSKITRGSTFKVTTSADDNILEHIQVIKTDRNLKIGLESGSYSLKTPLSAEITMPTIAGLDLSGATKTTVTGFDSERDVKTKVSGKKSRASTVSQRE